MTNRYYIPPPRLSPEQREIERKLACQREHTKMLAGRAEFKRFINFRPDDPGKIDLSLRENRAELERVRIFVDPIGPVLPPLPVQEALPLREGGILNGSQRKTAFALRMNVETLIKEGGLNSTGFLTLTVGDNVSCAEFGCAGCERGQHFRQVWDTEEASRRFNNLNRRLLPDLFERSIAVTERHKSGAIHFHLIGTLFDRPDIRTGFNFKQVKLARILRRAGKPYKHLYRSASEELRGLWAMLREQLPKYGFGIAELTPIEKTGQQIASYISKYIEKNVCARRPEDKNKKLVRYLGWKKMQDEPRYPKFGEMVGAQLKANDFLWGTPGACAWRVKSMETVKLINISTKEEAAAALGPRWANDITRIWGTVSDDRELEYLDEKGNYRKPEIPWTWAQKELIRAELVNMSGIWARKKEREKRLFADEAAEMRLMGPEMGATQLRQEINRPVIQVGQRVKNPINLNVFN